MTAPKTVRRLTNSDAGIGSDHRLVRQVGDWDCGIACVAMALRVSYESAKEMLGPPPDHRKGYFPHAIAAATGGEMDTYDWRGSLERCIVQVMLEPNGPPRHYVWIEDGIWCPAAHVTSWRKIAGFACIIRVPLPNAKGDSQSPDQ
jgi:hypothetical protein